MTGLPSFTASRLISWTSLCLNILLQCFSSSPLLPSPTLLSRDCVQWAYKAGTIEREVYKPGDQHHLPLGVAKGYRMPVLSIRRPRPKKLSCTAGSVLGTGVRPGQHLEHDAVRHL